MDEDKLPKTIRNGQTVEGGAWTFFSFWPVALAATEQGTQGFAC